MRANATQFTNETKRTPLFQKQSNVQEDMGYLTPKVACFTEDYYGHGRPQSNEEHPSIGAVEVY